MSDFYKTRQTGFSYMASPYSHADPLIREERYLRASKVLADRLRAGLWTYSPIVHCHELSKIWDMPKDAKFWEEYDFVMLSKADTFYILRLDGWEHSVGVKAEKEEAARLGKPIYYI